MHITGTNGDDVLMGTLGNDVIDGLDGNDTLFGNVGDDKLVGGNGDDHLDGGYGADVMNGGAGNDYIVVDDTRDAASGGGGSDTLELDFTEFGAAVTVDLTALWSGGVGTMSSGIGSNTIQGMEALDVIYGSSHNDVITIGNVSAVVSVNGESGDDTITGGALHNNIYGNDGNDTLNAGSAGDRLSGGDGADTVNGGAGNDIIEATDTLDTINGGGGVDTLALDFGEFTTGVTVDLTALWSGGVGTMSSAAGSGTIQGVEALSYIFGSGHNDVITIGNITADIDIAGEGGDDTINGGALHNNIYGNDGNDTLNAGSAGDRLSGGDGADTVNGGAGNDYVEVNDTLDTIDGGGGVDTLDLDFSEFTTGVTVDLTALWSGGVGTMSSAAGSGTIQGMEALSFIFGSRYNDVITIGNITSSINGEGGDDTINGGALHNTINGGDGNDTLNAGSAGDHLTGGDGADTVNGGAGNDTIEVNDTLDTVRGGGGVDTLELNFSEFTTGVTVDLTHLWSGGVGTMSSAAGSGTIKGMEVLGIVYGSRYNDTITIGNATSSINGEGGDDTITGGALHNAIYGGDGNDTLNAGSAGDRLTGGSGADILSGGAGNDMFSYGSASESTSTGYDTVIGFDTAKDAFDLFFGVTGIDPTVSSGTLSTASFDTDLASALSGLGSHHAILFTPTAGSLAGHTFLVVDANGVAGYQAGADLVMDLQSLSGSLSTGNFI